MDSMGLKKTIFLVFLVIILFQAVYATDSEIEKIVREYRGYDEIISEIREIDYGNTTYHQADYTKSLMYSGSLVIDDKHNVVKDKKILTAFIIAGIIHTNYQNDSMDQWIEFAQYFETHASRLEYMNLHNLSNDSMEIARLMRVCAINIDRSVHDFDPYATVDYLDTEERLIGKMEAALVNLEESGENYPDYKRSLVDIGEMIRTNRKFLMDSTEQMIEMLESRVAAEENKYEKTGALIGGFALIIGLVFLIRLKGSLSSKQDPPPRV